jgi:hypothetical protein
MAEGTKTKQKKVHALRQKVKVFRDADPVASVLMWGVNFMVHTTCDGRLFQMGELEMVPDPPLLMPADFKASSKISVQNNHYNRSVFLDLL